MERGLAGTLLLASLFPMIAATGDAQAWGHGVYIVILSAYFLLAYSSRVEPRRLGQLSVGTWSAAAGLLSWYFLPLWLGIPLTRQAWDARQWIGQILNWI